MYLEIDDGFLEHPKTLRFCRAIRERSGCVYLLRLWTWATKSAPDGDLTGLDPADIEDTVRWDGDPGLCYESLVAVGFIDEEGGQPRAIHNWGHRTGGAIVKMEERAEEKRQAWAEQKRRQRDAKRSGEPSSAVSASCPPNVRADIERTSTPCPPPKTRQDKTDQDKPRPAEPAQSDVRAGDPTTPGPVALARAVAVAVEQAGELVAAQAPRARATGYDVVQLYGRVRAECVQGCSPWDTPSGNSLQKADAFVASLREENAALLEPTMREFFRQAQDPNARPPPNPLRATRATFGFGAWLGDFPDLCQEVRGNRKPGGKAAGPKYCAFHGRERSAGKRAPKHEWRADCPECRHVDARGSKREGEPTSIGEMFQGIQPGG